MFDDCTLGFCFDFMLYLLRLQLGTNIRLLIVLKKNPLSTDQTPQRRFEWSEKPFDIRRHYDIQ